MKSSRLLEFDLKPRLNPDIFTAMKDGKVLLLNPEIPEWIVVNESTAYIIGQCDGEKSIKDIIVNLEEYGYEATSQVFSELFGECFEKGIFVNHNQPENTEVIEEPNELELIPAPLHSIHLKLTNKCNLACTYCYAESGLCTSSPTLSIQELIKIADDAKKLSSNISYTLSGGEPLMHPNALEFAEYIKKNGHPTCLLTNGALINRKNAKRISTLFDLIKISLDGSSDEINSLTRGRNTSKAAIKAFDLLLAENANVFMNMTVTQNNLSDVGNMVKRFGSRLNFQPLFKTGRGKFQSDDQITGDEYYRALSSVDGVNPLSSIEKVVTQYRGNGITKCPLADGDISISETGDVYPCQMLYEEEFKGGNVKQQSIIEIYNNAEAFKPLRKLHVQNIKGCSTCVIRKLCGGSCRARSYHETGDISVSGAFCDYERQAYINGILDCSEFH
jgi:radical SAM protein with 4Fe4S-binding SPASM domain